MDFVQNSTYDGKDYVKTVAATAAGQNTVSLKASETGNVTIRLTTDSASAADIQKVLDGVSVKVGETVQTAVINGAAATFAVTAGATTDFDFSLDLADGADAISGSATDLSDAVSDAKFTVVFTLEPSASA